MLTPLRQRVIAEARSWANPRTPFQHQQRLKGPRGGVDCLGLIWGVGEKAEVMDPVTDAQARPFWRFYGRRPNPPVMKACLAKFLVEISADQAAPGDLAWMHWPQNDMPIHMAILGDLAGRATLIHSVWMMGVVEHGMEDEHRSRVNCYWRYPAIFAEGM